MPGSTLTGVFVDSSFNIYTKAVVTFTSRNNTSNNRHVQKTFTSNEAVDMYCSSNHMTLPEAICKLYIDNHMA